LKFFRSAIREKPALSEIALLASRASAKRKPLPETKSVVQHPDPAANRIGDENLTSWQRPRLLVRGE